MKELLGMTVYKQLKLAANIYKKRDDKMDLIIIKSLIQTQNAKNTLHN